MTVVLDFYDKIRDQVYVSDIVKQRISLKKHSGEYIGLCPFHQEKTPSFTVNDSKRFYHCFGCGAHGDVIRFYANVNSVSYGDSARHLAGLYGIELPKVSVAQLKVYEESEEIFNILALASEYFEEQLFRNELALKYINTRSISNDDIKKFNIGYAPGSGDLIRYFEKKSISTVQLMSAGLVSTKSEKNLQEVFHQRIMFPIKNEYSKVIGFGGRAIGSLMPKYINSPETLVFKKGHSLYAENIAIPIARKQKCLILVEGYLDVIALNRCGINYVVASLGTAITQDQLRKIWHTCDELILCLDSDKAGILARNKAIHTMLPSIDTVKKVSFINLPIGFDPEQFINLHSLDQGFKDFQNLISRRINLSQMIWDIEFKSINLHNPEQSAALESILEDYCNKITNNILRKNYKQFFRNQIWKHRLSKKNMTAKFSSDLSEITSNITEISEIMNIEMAICSLISNMPELLKIDSVLAQCVEITFENVELSSIKDIIISNFYIDYDISTNSILELMKNSRLYDTFLLVSGQEFLKQLPIDCKTLNLEIAHRVWIFLYKQHYLLMLKKDCDAFLLDSSEENFKKVLVYKDEMQKISEQIKQMAESFVNK